jgi:hypothetical protein
VPVPGSQNSSFVSFSTFTFHIHPPSSPLIRNHVTLRLRLRLPPYPPPRSTPHPRPTPIPMPLPLRPSPPDYKQHLLRLHGALLRPGPHDNLLRTEPHQRARRRRERGRNARRVFAQRGVSESENEEWRRGRGVRENSISLLPLVCGELGLRECTHAEVRKLTYSGD